MRRSQALLAIYSLLTVSCWAQSPTATITGRVLDPTKAIIAGANIEATNVDTNVQHKAQTNDLGLFTIGNLPPGNYRVEISKPNFKTIVKPNITLHVQDVIALNFDMSVGSTAESVTVEAGAPLINTQDGSVSTVVDRNFAENLPMNGRSFQTLIQLTPGVVLTSNNSIDTGQFSVNGQRAASNYWMVDGVSANIGVSAVAAPGQGIAGTLGSSSVLGGTNSLVSVDALQEFRILTSTFAPEFGRTPGAQISISTRSGTNQFHGSAFDYLRNDIFDSNNWFNGYTNNPKLPKPKEKQNDFGGTLGGPIFRNSSFFFFSYEGLRLRLPQTQLTNVPDLSARQNASPAMQAFLNSYPIPNGTDNLSTGIAQFNSSYSNPSTLDAYSLRIDQKLKEKLNIFARYDYSPSQLVQRGPSGNSLSTVSPARILTQTGTLGLTWTISPVTINDFRINRSETSASLSFDQDRFGGAVPVTSLPFPTGFSTRNASFSVVILSLGFTRGRSVTIGRNADNELRQINIVDSISAQEGSHALKFGIDFRRLSPNVSGFQYAQVGVFSSVPASMTGKTTFTNLQARRDVTLLFRNLGFFAQDTWQLSPRMTATYGLRWDTDFTISSTKGPNFSAVTGFDVNNLTNLALASPGREPYRTTYGNIAPRIGLAYQASERRDWETVVRGGFGIFYDLASAQAGSLLPLFSYPFGVLTRVNGAIFPLTGNAGAPPPIVTPSAGSGAIFAFDPNLKLPYSLQWNIAVEQGLAENQMISASYIGSNGRRLLQTANIARPNLNFATAQFIVNGATSSYNALQIQTQRRLSKGLQALASYTWAHSIDTASAGSLGATASNAATPGNRNTNRGSSDFDVRHAFSAGITYDLPYARRNILGHALFGGWSIQNVVQARSAPPVDVVDFVFSQFGNGFQAAIRPDLVPGQVVYLFGSQYPGGKALNPAAFVDPPFNATTFVPLRQGNVPRNAFRGFGAVQWDLAVHRNFPIHEALGLQFRAEIFNVINHPNFGPPTSSFSSPQFGGPGGFGVSTQLLNQSLSGGNLGAGAFSPLYQIGGPRSLQFALKLQF